MNYQIVKNKEELEKFINFLPDLQQEEKFYYSLFARKKYGATEGLKSDKCQLKRGTTTKERMYRDFKKLEVEIGTYTIDDISIKQNSLVLYITPNPRDMYKAGLKTLKEIADRLHRETKIINPHTIALNQIQVSGRKLYFDIDIDFKKGRGCNLETLYNWIKRNEIINAEAIVGNVLKTRGGYHILVRTDYISEEYKKSWYQGFSTIKSDIFDITMNGDNMIPVPGCVQSDFIPKIYCLV